MKKIKIIHKCCTLFYAAYYSAYLIWLKSTPRKSYSCVNFPQCEKSEHNIQYKSKMFRINIFNQGPHCTNYTTEVVALGS